MFAMKLNLLSLHTTFFFLWSKYIENFTRFRFVSFRFVSIGFVSFDFVSFRSVSFRFVAFRFYFASHFTGTLFGFLNIKKNTLQLVDSPLQKL
jgi:hypothetical protein